MGPQSVCLFLLPVHFKFYYLFRIKSPFFFLNNICNNMIYPCVYTFNIDNDNDNDNSTFGLRGGYKI